MTTYSISQAQAASQRHWVDLSLSIDKVVLVDTGVEATELEGVGVKIVAAA